ncbi:MAG: PilZ domain [Clostridiales bacterium]|jgi:c-di-GMP-binding flagellar brake protein YcgR|nr:PilZ domain [Clostridiales bacterium]MDN5298375.1 PilZ domain [Clostridiales bacterium]
MDLSEYLLPSYSVDLSVSILDEAQNPTILKLKTVIETGYDNGFFKIVSPMHRGRMYVLHDDELITVTFYAGEDQQRAAYELTCKVIEKTHKGSNYTVTLRATSQPKKVQRRQAFRVNVFNDYTIAYKGKQVTLTTKDISSTGMRALSPVQMAKDDVFEIVFDANIIDPEAYENKPDPKRKFLINCRVIDSMPQTEIRRYMLRIQFLDLSNEQSKMVIQYLYAKQAEVIAYDTSLSAQRDQLEHLIEGGDDRRRGDDKIIKRYQMIGLLNVVVIFFALMFILFAQPKPLYSLDKFFNIRRAKYWDPNYFTTSMVLTLVAISFGSYGLILNGTRMKRSTDHFSMTLIVTIAIAVIMLFVSIYLLSTQNIYNVVA